MAENDQGQEKTEQPTPKKLEKAREDGQVPRSKELGTTFLLLGGVAALMILGQSIGQSLQGVMTFNFSLPREAAFDTDAMLQHLGSSADHMLQAVTPLFLFFLVAALLGPVCLGGWLLSAKALAPKLDRFNPIEGVKRMFSMNSLVELLKSVAKFGIVVGIAIMTLLFFETSLLNLAMEPLHQAIISTLHTVSWSALAVSSGMLLISAIDVPWQMFEHNKKMMMTRQEVREEMKDAEGKPEVRGKVRQLQREVANRRMMEAIPEADVVITNPEHFAVALRYDVDGGGAPVVVARGADFVALKIREIANAHNVLVLESPPLARAIYFTTDLDDEIPGNLYLAVAQVLAYVFQLRAHKAGTGRKPKPLGHVRIPQDAMYDHQGRRWQDGAGT